MPVERQDLCYREVTYSDRCEADGDSEKPRICNPRFNLKENHIAYTNQRRSRQQLSA